MSPVGLEPTIFGLHIDMRPTLYQLSHGDFELRNEPFFQKDKPDHWAFTNYLKRTRWLFRKDMLLSIQGGYYELKLSTNKFEA